MNNTNSFYFVGIGGVSMSGLAQILAQNGHKVAGSDINPKVKINGIKVFYEHNGANVDDFNVVVYNNAISFDNPEIKRAQDLGKKIISRAKLLGEIAANYKKVISVSGMHGKTSTTEMIAEILIEAGKNPTVHIGGISKSFNSNFLLGDNKFFITEACEFKDSFLQLKSDIGVVLNIEAEHLDYFENLENIKKSFEKFEKNCKKVVIFKNFAKSGQISFGNGGHFSAKNISIFKNFLTFDCYHKNKFFSEIKLNAIGKHNIENSLAAIATANALGIKKKHIVNALKNYKGVKRRMEIIKKNPLTVCDYAHHPTEIAACLNAVKQVYKQKIVAIFQPHTYSRTKNFFNKFINSLSIADEVILYKTYPAREKYIPGGSAKDLYEKLKNIQKNTFFFEKIADLKQKIENYQKNEYIFIYLGAGDWK